MVTLNPVLHCWNYSALCRIHLSAYVLNPPQRCRAMVTICYCGEDAATCTVLDEFRLREVPNVNWNFREFPRRELCRRAIGRNVAALASTADFVLFGDVDYCFGPGSLDAAADALVAANSRGPVIAFPSEILVSRTPEDGDAEIQRAREGGLIDVRRELLEPRRQPRAIGGSQWVPGDMAREHGYLPHSRRFQRPSEQWRRTFEDNHARGWYESLGAISQRVDVPNVYRIRHSSAGRFVEGCSN